PGWWEGVHTEGGGGPSPASLSHRNAQRPQSSAPRRLPYVPASWSKNRLAMSILLTMTIAATPVPLSEAKARLSELARRVRQQHERITLTRNGEPEAVLLSVDDLEGLEMTLEILGDTEAVARISESLAGLGRGEPGAGMATVRQGLARRRVTGPWRPHLRHGTKYGFRPPHGRRALSGFPKPLRLPCWSSAQPRSQRILTGSASRCSGRWPVVTVPGAAPIASSTGSTRTAASSTYSTSTTAPRSTAA